LIGLLNGIATSNYRTYGVPTIRSDLPSPIIKRISDNKNYGDESDGYALISPSIYSKYGLTERDFFMARSPEEIKQIFTAIGVQLEEKTFLEVWKRAQEKYNEVSIETFRSILDESQASQIETV